jgi:hypothetical protein
MGGPMNKFIIGVILLYSSLCFAGEDPDGWKAARWGMSMKELLIAIPEAHETYASDTGSSKYSKIAVIEKIVINGKNYKVSFLSSKGTDKLVRVNVESTDAQISDFAHSDLIKSLSEKYGSPSDVEKKRSPMGAIYITTIWYFPKTTIEVFYTNNDLFISYSQKQVESNL